MAVTQDAIDLLAQAPVPPQRLLIDGSWLAGEGGETTVLSPLNGQMLTTLADKVVRHRDCAGWHLQVFAHPEQIVALAPWLHKLPVPLVIDHLGHIDPSEGPAAEAYGVLRRLLDGGRTWVKLSGAYMRSSVHGPKSGFEDLPARSYQDAYGFMIDTRTLLRPTRQTLQAADSDYAKTYLDSQRAARRT